jgi:hypothetical protein
MQRREGLMDRAVADNSMGLMKAFHFLAKQQQRPIKPKYRYEPAGSAIHASRRLTAEERNAVSSKLDELKTLDPSDRKNDERIQKLVSALGKLPVKFVPVKSEIRIKVSKTYPYASKKRGG